MRKWSLLCVLSLSIWAPLLPAQPEQSFGVNAMLTPGGSVYTFLTEFYENPFDNVSYTVKAGKLGFSHTDIDLREEGQGFTAGAGLRYYKYQIKEGIYLATGLEFYYAGLETRNTVSAKSNETLGILPSVEMGYSFNIGRIKFEPNAILSSLALVDKVQSNVLTAVGVSIWTDF